MKKQFFRVKQLADQTFSRAGKTDVLSDDLQGADRKVEYIKTSCQNVGKKLSACLLLGQLQGESATKEKLLKKSPEYQLGATMIECSNICDDDSLMKIILSKCGDVEKSLAEENAEHDHRVEQHVVTPLQNVLDNEIPSIVKHKRIVTKVCLDMDSAKTRYQQAQKHNANNTAGAAKVESIKDELEECEQKVEQSRDVLACEMFHLASRESEICHTILQYYKLQRGYHEYALHILDKLIPELENDVCASSVKPVYGVDLKEHLRVTERKIAFPIELSVCALLELGMEEEGLFRLAGGASKVKRMKLSFDAGCMTLATALAYKDPHVIAGALKSYLRELPEPLLTHDLYDEWLNAAKAQLPSENKLQALWTVVHKLPKANYDNLSYLIKFFHVLSRNHEVNKMSPQNIAIVIAPSLIWTKEENGASSFGMNINAANLYPSIIDLLVTYADWFFDKDIKETDFYVTLDAVVNGETDEKGIDNKGFDLKSADRTPKTSTEKERTHMRNHSGDHNNEVAAGEMKRSQSINSLTDDGHAHDSPKPVTRRKNKSAAPVPPGIKDKENNKTKKEESKSSAPKDDPAHVSTAQKPRDPTADRPDKPPRPTAPAVSTSTLPRPAKSNRENKSTETSKDDIMTQSVGRIGFEKLLKTERSPRTGDRPDFDSKKEKIQKATVSTNTEPGPGAKEIGFVDRRMRDKPVAAPRSISSSTDASERDRPTETDPSKGNEYNKVDLINVKKEWLLGKDNSSETEGRPVTKPIVPERPSGLKPHPLRSRNSLESNLRNNYENVSLSSNENLSGGSSDERTLQKTQMYSIDKHEVSIINVTGNEEKGKKDEDLETIEDLAKEDRETNKRPHVPTEKERKDSVSGRPLSCPGAEKPERPPKPEYMSSSPSSHNRTFSDGQIVDIKPRDTTNNNNNQSNSNISSKNCSSNNSVSEIHSGGIKHPRTSPPPPPVPAKPRADSHGESTDF